MRGPRAGAAGRRRETLALRAWALRHIPLLFFLSPSVVSIDTYRAVLRVPLSWRSKNHLGSMYFGALCTGADAAVAVLALQAMKGRVRLSVLFKDLRADFLKRAEGDVHFACDSGEEIARLFDRAEASGERETARVGVVATVPEKLGEEPVVVFELTVSVKAVTRR